MVLRVTRVKKKSFPSIFSLLRPSILDLGSGTGQTDGQTHSE